MKRIIVSCDDLGINKQINLAIRDCAEQGVISSSSIVVNGGSYEHALNNIIDKIPLPFFGLHLNLTEGTAINKDNFNIICDEKNVFNLSAKRYFLSSFFKPSDKFKKAVYNEFKCQIKKALNDGIKISHFDSHEHIHHSPWIFKIIIDLGKEFKINKIRLANEKIILKSYFKNVYYKFKTLNYLKHFLISRCIKKIKKNFLSTDYFFGVLNSGKIEIDELASYLDKIDSNKSLEVCIHPSNEVLENTETSKREFYLSKNRIKEKQLLLSERFRNLLKNKKISLINFSEIN